MAYFSVNLVILVGLTGLAGFAKAIRDTIAHHWERSVFNFISNEFLREWMRSDWRNRPHHCIWFIWDGWHFAESILYASLFSMMLLRCGIWDVGFGIAAFGLSFNLWYHKFLLKV